MRFDIRPRFRPVMTGWLAAILLTLLSVASALADGNGPPFPK